MGHPVSPYLVPGFYDKALAAGRHRDIVGGRWEETGRIQMQALRDAGLEPRHRLLDIGAGSLRLGCKAIPFLHAGHYWATDASLALMQRGREVELPDPDRLPPDHLIADDGFFLPGVPDTIDFAIAFGVFTHLPPAMLELALSRMRPRLATARCLLLTVFLAPEGDASRPVRQADGVVTHPDRPPYHMKWAEVTTMAMAQGWDVTLSSLLLPRGQKLVLATPLPCHGTNQP